jgi:hypothetical protein
MTRYKCIEKKLLESVKCVLKRDVLGSVEIKYFRTESTHMYYGLIIG